MWQGDAAGFEEVYGTWVVPYESWKRHFGRHSLVVASEWRVQMHITQEGYLLWWPWSGGCYQRSSGMVSSSHGWIQGEISGVQNGEVWLRRLQRIYLLWFEDWFYWHMMNPLQQKMMGLRHHGYRMVSSKGRRTRIPSKWYTFRWLEQAGVQIEYGKNYDGFGQEGCSSNR